MHHPVSPMHHPISPMYPPTSLDAFGAHRDHQGFSSQLQQHPNLHQHQHQHQHQHSHPHHPHQQSQLHQSSTPHSASERIAFNIYTGALPGGGVSMIPVLTLGPAGAPISEIDDHDMNGQGWCDWAWAWNERDRKTNEPWRVAVQRRVMVMGHCVRCWCRCRCGSGYLAVDESVARLLLRWGLHPLGASSVVSLAGLGDGSGSADGGATSNTTAAAVTRGNNNLHRISASLDATNTNSRKCTVSPSGDERIARRRSRVRRLDLRLG